MESCQQNVANVTQGSPEAPYYVKGLVLGLSAYLIGIHLWTWVLTVSVFLGGRSDFRQLYTAGYMVRTGHSHELYEYNAQRHFQNQLVSPGDIALPFNHLAYEALLFVPFSLLSYRTAYFTLLGLNLTVLAITFKFLRPWMKNLAVIYRWLPPVMFLAFLPVAAALLQGQDSILLLTLLAASLVSLHSGRELAAGVLVGLGLFKFQIVIPIALLFLVWRRWRFSAGFVLAAILVGLLSLSLVGLSQVGVYFRSLLLMSLRLASPVDQFKYGDKRTGQLSPPDSRHERSADPDCAYAVSLYRGGSNWRSGWTHPGQSRGFDVCSPALRVFHTRSLLCGGDSFGRLSVHALAPH